MEKISGVYEIRNTVTGWRYIGSSVNIDSRIRGHKWHLKHHDHFSSKIQNDWDGLGEDNFVFTVLEKCEPKDILTREQFYIDTLKPEYNVTAMAGNPASNKTRATLGKLAEALRGKLRTPEQIEKMRAGLEAARKAKTPKNKTCQNCGAVFETINPVKVYCSGKCKQAAYNARLRKKQAVTP